MRLTPREDHRQNRLLSATLFLLAVGLTCAGLAGLASSAKAAPVNVTFDHGKLSLGILENRTVLPADPQFPSPDLPTPQPRRTIQLSGDLSNGNLSFSQLQNPGTNFPYMNVLNPIDPTIKIPFTFRLNPEGLSGTYDESTGNATIAGPMDVYIIVGLGTNPLSMPTDISVPPLGLFARCKFDDVPVSFSTETKSPFTAAPFSGGFGVNGSLTTSWTDFPASTAENAGAPEAANCDTINGIRFGLGGIWLSNGIVEPEPQPVPEPTCETDIRVCPDVPFFEVSATKVTPRKLKLKAGGKRKLKVTVTNIGTQAGTAKVRLKSSNRRVRVPKRIKIPVGASAQGSKSVTVKVKRKAKGRAVITATSNGWSGKARLKVKPARKSR